MNIVLVYDRVNKFGGAERVLQTLHKIWPEAPLYTSVYDPESTPWTKDWDVRISFLQKFPWARRNHESLGWLMPLAFESLDLSGFDVVISVTSEAAKGVITSPRQLHICYLLTPIRYLWSHARKYLILSPRFLRPAAFVAQTVLRQWDFVAAQRPDHIIAVSEHVQRRCEKYYRREATVIHPPMTLQVPEVPNVPKVPQAQIRLKRPGPANSQGQAFGGELGEKNYFLIVSRLVPYKRIDLAIEAANKIGDSLIVIGSGKDKKRLQRLARLASTSERESRRAGSTVQFIEHVSDKELVEYYRNAKALLMPQEEDFGLVALEAQACGTPVVTYRQSGAAEVVIDGKTGRLFDRQDVSSLIRAMRDCPEDPRACTIQASRFSKKRFQNDFREQVERLWRTHNKT